MADFNERVTRLEERSDAHTRVMEHVLTEMIDLRRSMDALRIELRTEIGALRTEVRTEMAAFRAEIREDIADLRASMDRRFTWLVGIQVAGLVAVIGALVGAYHR